MLLGLTGKYCAGKNHVASLLEKRGLAVLDVDKLGHQAIEEAKEAIIARFGPDIKKTDGTIDRRALGQLVFGQPEALAALEAIVHPIANRLSEQWVERHQAEQAAAQKPALPLVINAALLHRSSLFPRLDGIILVKAPFITRLIRASKRDRLPLLTLLPRLYSQKNFEAQYFANKTDIYIIQNKGIWRPCVYLRAGFLNRQIDSILAKTGMVR